MTFSQILLMLAIQAAVYLALIFGAHAATTSRGRIVRYGASLVALLVYAAVDIPVIIRWAAGI